MRRLSFGTLVHEAEHTTTARRYAGDFPAVRSLRSWLRDRNLADQAAARAIWASGVECLPVSIYCDKQTLRPGIMFGFACASESEIARNAARAARAVREIDGLLS